LFLEFGKTTETIKSLQDNPVSRKARTPSELQRVFYKIYKIHSILFYLDLLFGLPTLHADM